jgi:hypothetical protein
MRNYIEGVNYETPLRSQPWTKSEFNPESKYYDYVNHPELIRTSLEDFKPFERYESVQQLYGLLEWINGPDSPYETNDCRLDEFSNNRQFNLAPKKLVVHGVLGFFFRNLVDNIAPDSLHWATKFLLHQIDQDGYRMNPNDKYKRFMERSQVILNSIPVSVNYDCLGLTLMQVWYEKCPGPDLQRAGFQFIWQFWVWGDDEKEIFKHFSSTVNSMEICLKALAPEFAPTK